jgi:dipeptidyl aminopeptidase/acylaminoacyl peptidase
MVFLHGHSLRGNGALRMVPVAEIFARDVCVAGLAISLPGYGETPRGNGSLEDTTRSAVLDAVQAAKRLSWIDADHIYVYGFSRGAAVAVALADEIPGIRAVLLHSGAYDLTRLYDETPSFWLRVLLNPQGDEKPRFQDLLARVGEWRFSTLVLHGEQDSLVPFSQAVLLRDRLASLNKTHRLVAFPDHGHRLPIQAIQAEALKFLRETGGNACAFSDP